LNYGFSAIEKHREAWVKEALTRIGQ